MRTLDEALDQFVYHPATPDTAPRHSAVRDIFAEMVPRLWDAVPDGPEKTLMLREVQKASMYANLAIALTAPADTGPTRATARVLPEGPYRLDPESRTEVALPGEAGEPDTHP